MYSSTQLFQTTNSTLSLSLAAGLASLGQPLLSSRKRTFSDSTPLPNGHSSSQALTTDVLGGAKSKQNPLLDPAQPILGAGQNQKAQLVGESLRVSTQDDPSLEAAEEEGECKESTESCSKAKKITQAQLMGKTAGRWTKEEHKKFVQGIKIYGKDWKKVEEFVQTRSGAQIRSHAQKYFIRIQKKLKGNSGQYLNQTEDQCSTAKGLELFRQTIMLYEEGVKDDNDEDDDFEYIASTAYKRPRHSMQQSEQINRIPNESSFRAEESYESPARFTLLHSGTTFSSLPDRQQKDSEHIQHHSSTNPQSFFLINEVQRKQLQAKFYEIVKRKEMIMTDIYFNEKIDLFNDGRKYLGLIQDILNDIQKLSQKLTIINQISGLLDPSQTNCSLLERLLILINEVVNLQKVLTDLINNNEYFNKPADALKLTTQAATSSQLFQAPTITNSATQSSINLAILTGLMSAQNQQLPQSLQLSAPTTMTQASTQSQVSTSILSQLSQLMPAKPTAIKPSANKSIDPLILTLLEKIKRQEKE